ncbi:hypothetical protein ACN6K5_003592 [Streptomyces violaceoruber]|uniref:hypothetical protein n=1 Tax=Streptomyces violaceoruber TaxID=1935 RepID=UPI00403C505F
MSEWNLSVRLTGQGSGLSRTLRSLSGDARTASRNVNALRRDIDQLRADTRNPIRVRLDVDAGHLRRDVRTALASAGSGQGLRVRLGLDAGHLRSDVSAALSAAGAGQGLAVNLRLGNAMQLRREVEDAVRWASWGHRIEIPLVLADPMQLRRDVSAAVRWASMNQTIRVRVDPDTSRLRTPLPGLPSLPGGGGGGGAGFDLAGLMPIATAAIPLIAGLAANLAPLAGMFAAAGGGAAAFGIALSGQTEPLKEVADAEKKYQEAARDNGAASKEAVDAQIAYQKQLNALPPETQKAAVALSQLKQTFGDWSDDMAAFTMAPVEKSFTLLEQLIPRLSPEVESFSGELDRLLNVAGGAIATPGFDALSDKVASLTDAKLDSFTDQIIHLLRVVSEGDAGGGSLGQIIDYAKENGPEARAALDAIADAVGNLLEAGSEVGPTMLTLVTAAAKLVAALPPEAVAVILQMVTALKLMQLAGLGAAAVSGGVTRLSTAIATLSATSAAAGGGLAGFRAAVASLSAGARFGAAAAGVAALVFALHELSDNKPAVQVDELSTSLNTLISTGKVTGTLSTNLDEMASSIAMVSKGASDNKLAQWTSDFGTWIGIAEGPGISTARENVDAWDQSMANLVRAGNPEQAAAQYELLKNAWQAGGGDLERLKKFTTEYDDALADAAFEQQMAAQSMGLFGSAAQDTTGKLEAQKQSADGLRQAITALNDVNRAAGSAMSAFEQSIDDANEAIKEHGNALKLRNGELDLGSEKSREAEKALSDLAANTEAAATSAREQGKSWEDVNAIYDKGRSAFIKTADAMGLTSQQAEILADKYLSIPDSKTTRIEMRTEDAVAGLDSVIAAIQATPNRKTVTVAALTSDAISMLQDLGFTVERLPNGEFSVTADTATAKQRLADVQSARDGLKNKTITLSAIDAASKAADAVRAAIAKVKSKQVTITARYQTIGIEGAGARADAKMQGRADGAVVDYYADGGMRENHVAQIAPAGQYRVWAEQETGGEAYIPLASSKRARSRAIAEETVQRLGGDPAAIQWNAAGSLSDWRYDPGTGSLYSPSDAGRAGHKTKKVKGKDVDYFDVGAVERKLWDLGQANVAWARNLEKVAERAGTDVAETLASMGEDGVKIAAKMATGTNKYVASMSIALRNLEKTARASLSAFTVDLNHAVGNQSVFQENLAKLAAQGYGSLAAHLAGQNDEAAYDLAAAAAGDRSKADKANKATKRADQALTPDQLSQLVQIIAAITTKTTSLHAVAGKTGLGEDEIIAVANKAKQQITDSLGGRAARFLQDLAKANKGLAYADGGIRAGIYATRGGLVRFAEPETHGEAYLPLSPSKRRTALPVLADVANRFGVGLTDASAGRPVVIVKGGDTTQVTVTPVRTGATASDIGAQVGRSVRRARRGGVAARAGA